MGKFTMKITWNANNYQNIFMENMFYNNKQK